MWLWADIAIITSLDLILSFTFQHNYLHMCPALTVAKLYSNTLLATFNNRVQFRGGRTNWPLDNKAQGMESLSVDVFARSRDLQINPPGMTFAEPGPGSVDVSVRTAATGHDIPMFRVEVILRSSVLQARSCLTEH